MQRPLFRRDLSLAPQIVLLASSCAPESYSRCGGERARANATSLISGALSPYLDQNSTKIDWSMAVDNSSAGFPISGDTVAPKTSRRGELKANSNMNLTFVTSLCDEIRAKAGADTKASDEAATFCSQSAGEPKRLRNGQEAVNTSIVPSQWIRQQWNQYSYTIP